MDLKKKLLAEGLKLIHDPRVLKVAKEREVATVRTEKNEKNSGQEGPSESRRLCESLGL